jgi:hypothetical protein
MHADEGKNMNSLLASLEFWPVLVLVLSLVTRDLDHWFKFLNFFSEREIESGIVKKLKSELEQAITLWLEPDLKSELAPKPPLSRFQF